MKNQKIIVATVGTALIGGAIYLAVRKIVKNNEFAELMLSIKQDEAQAKGQLSYLKAFDPKFVDEPDPLKRKVLLYTTAKVETLVDGLKKALKGLGTDEKAIYSIYNLIESQKKMSQVAKRYGIKNDKTLLTALTDDLDEGERKQLFGIAANKPEVQFAT